jgi:hypothetical protein
MATARRGNSEGGWGNAQLLFSRLDDLQICSQMEAIGNSGVVEQLDAVHVVQIKHGT